jgi:hypothetical protein
VATGALVGIESRPQASAGFSGKGSADRVDLKEAAQAVVKEALLGGRQTLYRSARADRSAARSGIMGRKLRLEIGAKIQHGENECCHKKERERES